jgi:TolA-binding protein
MLSLCFFMKGDNKQALKAAKGVILYEPLEKKLYSSNEPNSYNRLVRGYTLGWMRCRPEELALFSGKLRTAALLGDFYYEIEDEPKCLEIRRNLVNGKYGKLNREQTASAKYRLAEILYRMFKIKEARKVLSEFEKKYSSTLMYPTAMIGLGNICSGSTNPDIIREALKFYQKALKKAGSKRHIHDAMYNIAAMYYRLGKTKKALAAYKKLYAKYPHCQYKPLIEAYIKKLEKNQPLFN